MRVFKTENDWLVAEDRDDLFRLLVESDIGITAEECRSDADEATELAPHTTLTVHAEDEMGGLPPSVSLASDDASPYGYQYTATCAEWAAVAMQHGSSYSHRLLGSSDV